MSYERRVGAFETAFAWLTGPGAAAGRFYLPGLSCGCSPRRMEEEEGMSGLSRAFGCMLAAAGSVAFMLGLNSAALGQGLHVGNANSPEARSCASYIEARYNRRSIDQKDWRDDVERSVQITFYSVAQVPHLFGGNKFVSLSVREFLVEGEEIADDRLLRNASYCILDRSNRVIGLSREMR